MHLIAYLKTGPTAQHTGGWRHPESTLDAPDGGTSRAIFRSFVDAAREAASRAASTP